MINCYFYRKTNEIMTDTRNMQDQERLQKQTKEALEHASREIKHEIISNQERTAKKDMKCNASDYVRIFLNKEKFEQMSDEEKQIVGRVRRNDFMIKKGDKYIRQRGIYDGKAYVSKFMLDVMQLVEKYNLYQK